jgi:hypothetical protein
MRPLLVAFLVLAMPCVVKAQQSIAPSVNNLVGIDAKLSGAFIATSIGELAITTLGTDKGFITQGFLQPELLPCVDLEFKYWPNPATDIVTIEAYGCEVKIASMEIFDLWGRLLTTVAPKVINEVNLGDLPQGVYLVKVKLTNEDVHTISIVKTSK